MADQPFDTPITGQADWDSGLTSNFQAIERGYHITQLAGTDISTGQVLWLNSGGYFFPFNPNSESIFPHAYSYLAVGSGETLAALARGIVRSLDINSLCVPGRAMFVSAKTPGYLVASYAASNRQVGIGLDTGAILFDPAFANRFLPARLTSSVAIAAVTGSLHNFSMSAGRYGWNRQTLLLGNSADLVELAFYANSAHTFLLYQTKSGGVTTVGSYLDRAGWPYENTDATTLCDLVYGTLKVLSPAAVGSDTISVQMDWDRER